MTRHKLEQGIFSMREANPAMLQLQLLQRCTGVGMRQKYDHLSLEEQCHLRGMMKMYLSKAEMAHRLECQHNTIDRELLSNSNRGRAQPNCAGRLAWAQTLRGLPNAAGKAITHGGDRILHGTSRSKMRSEDLPTSAINTFHFSAAASRTPGCSHQCGLTPKN